MEKAAAGSRTGCLVKSGGIVRHGIVAAVACVAGAGAWAQDAALDLALQAERAADAPVRLELNATSLPRLDGQEAGQSQRLDLSVLPASGSGMGVAVGMSSFAPASNVPPAGFAATAKPALDLGLHYRYALPKSRQVDVTAYRRLSPESVTAFQPEPAVYGARVELGLQPTRKAGFATDRGFVGVQLQSGARISIKRRNGGPMVYYRNTF